MVTESGSLHPLLHKGAIWRGRQTVDQPRYRCLNSGFLQLNAPWPGQGRSTSPLVALLYSEEGSGELRALLPLLAELSQQERWVLWVDPPNIPYAPDWLDAGVNLDRVQVVRSNRRRDRLWCLEQSLKSGCCSAVLGGLPAG